MLVSRLSGERCPTIALDRRTIGPVCNCQQAARGARGTVSVVVGVVRAGPGALDVRPRVGAEPPFRERVYCQKQLIYGE